MKVRIRCATPDDVDLVKRVCQDCNDQIGKSPVFYFMVWLKNKKDNEHYIVIEDECLNPIGFANYRIRRDGVKVLSNIGFLRDKQRLGAGRLVLEYIGYPMELKTNSDNVKGNNFYLKNGFAFQGVCFAKSDGHAMNKYRREK